MKTQFAYLQYSEIQIKFHKITSSKRLVQQLLQLKNVLLWFVFHYIFQLQFMAARHFKTKH